MISSLRIPIIQIILTKFLNFWSFQKEETSLLNDQNESCTSKEVEENLELCREEERLSHEKEIAELKTKLSQEIAEKNQQMILMTEYKKTTEKLIAESNEEINRLKTERDDVKRQFDELQKQLERKLQDIDNLQASFKELHEKYNRAQRTIQIQQRNIEILEFSLADHQHCIQQKHSQFLRLKEHATERLNYANKQLQWMEQRFSTENIKLREDLNQVNLKFESQLKHLENEQEKNVKLNRISQTLLKKMNISGEVLNLQDV